MLRNILKILAIFIIGTIGGIFADQILWPYFVERPLFYQYNLEQAPVYVTERKEIIVQENQALSLAIEKVEKTVVGVRTKTRAGKVLEGSGIILTSDGLMVTFASLLPQGETFSFYWQGKPVSFQVLKRDLNQDLALIKLEGKDFPTTGFGDSKIKLGERVFLVGIVFSGPKKIAQNTVNQGIIKNFDDDFIKTNISENELLFGSPLFNIAGKVLGLNFIDQQDTIDQQGRVITMPISKIKVFADL